MSVTVFVIQGSNELNEALNKHLNDEDRRIHLVPSKVSLRNILKPGSATTGAATYPFLIWL